MPSPTERQPAEPGSGRTAGACDVSVVVPTYHEAGNLRALIAAVFAAVSDLRAEMVIVDDNSQDGTAELVAELASRHPVRCVVRTTERGLATAVMRGIADARGARVVVMDADLSHPAEAIPALVGALDDPAVNMSIGSRFVGGGRIDERWSTFRHLNSWVARQLARPLTGLHDAMSGFFCVRRREVELSRLQPVGYKIALELIVRHNWRRVVEVPITFRDRAAGESKLSAAEQLRYLRHLARLYGVAIGRRLGARR